MPYELKTTTGDGGGTVIAAYIPADDGVCVISVITPEGVEISSWLSAGQLKAITGECQAEFDAMVKALEADAAISRWESKADMPDPVADASAMDRYEARFYG